MPDYVYFVVHGAIKLVHVNPDGREAIVELASRGDLVGAHSTICREACQENAVTLTNCRLARWGSAEFRTRLAADAAFAGAVCRVTCWQVRALRHRLLEFAARPAKERLEGLFQFWLARVLAGTALASSGFELPLTREELGQYLSITPYHLSRVLGELEGARIILRKGRHIRVLPSAVLQAEVS